MRSVLSGSAEWGEAGGLEGATEFAILTGQRKDRRAQGPPIGGPGQPTKHGMRDVMQNQEHSGVRRPARFLLAMAGALAGVLTLGADLATAGAKSPSGALEGISQDGVQDPYYMVVGPGGATARNTFSNAGVSIGTLAEGTILTVYSKQVDWLEVEVPGGFEVWVYGQFLEPTAVSGELEVNGHGVRQRPLPSAGVESFPLRQKLFGGDRVHVIRRQNPGIALAEDWVQIYSPPGVRAWLRADGARALPAGSNGAKMWGNAVREVEQSRQGSSPAPNPGGNDSGTPGEGGTPIPAAAPNLDSATIQAMGDAMAEANAMMAVARRSKNPDFKAVRAAYQAVLALSEQGLTAELARDRLRELDLLEEGYRLEQQLESERAAREELMRERQDRIDAAGRVPRDPFEGRYQARGWLERIEDEERGLPVYRMRWGGYPVAELVCTSGRYDLDVFLDFELGVRGRTLRPGVQNEDGEVSTPPRIDVSRIEVISGRNGR